MSGFLSVLKLSRLPKVVAGIRLLRCFRACGCEGSMVGEFNMLWFAIPAGGVFPKPTTLGVKWRRGLVTVQSDTCLRCFFEGVRRFRPSDVERDVGAPRAL